MCLFGWVGGKRKKSRSFYFCTSRLVARMILVASQQWVWVPHACRTNAPALLNLSHYLHLAVNLVNQVKLHLNVDRSRRLKQSFLAHNLDMLSVYPVLSLCWTVVADGVTRARENPLGTHTKKCHVASACIQVLCLLVLRGLTIFCFGRLEKRQKQMNYSSTMWISHLPVLPPL